MTRLGAGADAAAYPAAAPAALDPGLSGFGRMFDLPAFANASASVEQALLELGKPGGLMDLRDRVRDNPRVSAGMTFFAQFMTHDITFDATSALGVGTPLANAFNARTSAFDLESVYLSGPQVNPELYDPANPAKLRVEGGGVHDVLRNGRRYYRPSGRAFVPLEFQSAAFRFGHSTARPAYRLNGSFAAPLFAAGGDDLRGGVRDARNYADWGGFFDFAGVTAQRSKRIGPHVVAPLFDLPLGAIPTREGPTSLAQRDLLRHLTWRLPSGQAVARRMKAPVLEAAELHELAALGGGLARSTPLWYYVLEEAAVVADGLRLGPVGGRIVAEVVIGILQVDRRSYLRVQPRWKPTFGGASFRMTDFLAFAGVDPKSRLRRTSGTLT